MLNKLWHNISHIGLNNEFSSSKRKNIILSNQINIAMLIIISVLSIFLKVLRIVNDTEMTFASQRLLIIIGICILNLYLSYKRLFILLKISLIFIPAFIFFILSPIVGFVEEESYFYYPYIAIALSVVMQLILHPHKDKTLYVISILYYLTIISLSDNILTHFSPVKYKAAIIVEEFSIFYKVTAVTIFTFIHSSIYYLRILNFRYEKELTETLKKLQNTQANLIQSEKMASLGILTAGVAHEINNPLNYIMGGYNGIEDYLNDKNLNNKETQTLLSIIKTGIDRAAGIVKSLNQFSRDNSAYDEICDIHPIIESCLTMLNSLLKENTTITKEFSTETLIIKGNSGKLHQVFLNIISNAAQSISEKGSISILTFRKENNIYISIKDSGSGIKKENLKKVTDPFFTTKAPGEGTGLGLSISYNIIKEHKGEITIDSKEGMGTSVNITLPI